MKYEKIFNDLDAYRNFCREYGYVYDEKNLYKGSTNWGQFIRWKKGDRVVNNWSRDANYAVE